MLTVHLDMQAVNHFVQRILHEIKLQMGDTPYRVVEVIKLDNAQVRGYYYAPTRHTTVGRSEYNATVDISVEVHTVRAQVVPIKFQMKNPLDLRVYNLEIESTFNSLTEVCAHESRLSKEYHEALQSMLYLVPTGAYAKDSSALVCEVSCLETSDIITEGCKTYEQLNNHKYSITSVVGLTFLEESTEKRHGVNLWNIFAYVYLHEFLVYKTDWQITEGNLSSESHHLQAFKKLSSLKEAGTSQLTEIVEGTTDNPYKCASTADFDRQCMYFDVVLYNENGDEIDAWYHFTPAYCLQLVRRDEYMSFEIVYDNYFHDFEYIIGGYETVTPFIAEFFKWYKTI